MNLNKVLLTGRIARVDEMRKAGDHFVLNFAIANDKGKDNTQFINIEAWNNTAKFISEYLGKGRQVLVEGRLNVDSYEKDGQKVTRLKVVANTIEAFGSRQDNQGGQNGQGVSSRPAANTQTAQNNAGSLLDDDDVPFISDIDIEF